LGEIIGDKKTKEALKKKELTRPKKKGMRLGEKIGDKKM